MTDTLLVLTPQTGSTPQIEPYSARGLTQTCEVITGAGGSGGGAWIRRDVNGILRSVADTRFRKYKSTITCRDNNTPCIDDAWIGITVAVSCTFELSYPTGSTPARPPVSGSQRIEGTNTFYRPLLTMIITDIKNSFQEYQAINEWTITLEEV